MKLQFAKAALGGALIHLLLAVSAVSAHAATTVSLSGPASPVQVGDDFDVLVSVAGVQDLSAYQFDLSFDPTLLSFQSQAEGSFLSAGGSTFFLDGVVDPALGQVTGVANTLLGAVSGVSGSGVLLDLKFHALAKGVASLDLGSLQLLDANGGTLSATSSGLKVQVGAVPEPGNVLAMVSGMAVLLGSRRVRQLAWRRPQA